MVRAVIFDVDGTLLDSEKIYMEAWRQASARMGFVMTETALLRTRAVSRERATEIFHEELGPDFNYMDVRPLRVEIENELFRTAEDLTKPGARELLDWLQARKLPLGIASTNLTAETRKHLEQFGLLDYFSVIVGGDQVTHAKPDPEIFLRAASLLGVSPRDCLAIGDSPADAGAASGGNIPIILVPDQVQPDDAARRQALAVVHTLHDVLPLLEPLLSFLH